MSKKTVFNTRFWEDNYVSDLDPIEKLIFIYAITTHRVSLCGIYEVPIKAMALETGIDREMIPKILTRLAKDNKLVYEDGWMCIVNYPKHQNYNKTTMVKAISREIEQIPPYLLKKFIEYGYPIDTLSIGYKEQVQVKVKDKVKDKEEETSKIKKEKYGEFQNVFLKPEEYIKLTEQYGEEPTRALIEELSGYIESTGKRYKSHYATLLNWARRKMNEHVKQKKGLSTNVYKV